MLLDQLGKVIQTRSNGQGEEAEAQQQAEVANQRENPHDGGCEMCDLSADLQVSFPSNKLVKYLRNVLQGGKA